MIQVSTEPPGDRANFWSSTAAGQPSCRRHPGGRSGAASTVLFAAQPSKRPLHRPDEGSFRSTAVKTTYGLGHELSSTSFGDVALDQGHVPLQRCGQVWEAMFRSGVALLTYRPEVA